MRIVFIAPTLAKYIDGIGDYTYLLAESLNALGHTVVCVSVRDHFIDKEIEEMLPSGLHLIRLSDTLPWSYKIPKIQQIIDTYEAEWVSLQFAPYPFQNKGCPVRLGHMLSKLHGSFSWHIMFHELWVGPESLKLKIYGFLQKNIVKKLISTLKPRLIHTQLPYHQTNILSIGFKAFGLPLFSNIPYISPAVKLSTDLSKVEKEYFTVGLFSQFKYSEPLLYALNRVNNLAKSLQYKLRIWIIGGKEAQAETLHAILFQKMPRSVLIEKKGNYDSADMSTVLQQCDVGLTPVPRRFLGKSGTVAAFANNGIPVIAPVYNNKNEMEPGFLSDSMKGIILHNVDIESMERSALMAAKTLNTLNPTSIGIQFAQDIANASTPVIQLVKRKESTL